MLKGFFYYLSENRLLKKAASRWGYRFGAAQFVAGETIEEAIETVSSLEAKGYRCTLSYLGEFVMTREEAEFATEVCSKTLQAMAERNVQSHLSIKLTQLGLDIDWELTVLNVKKLVELAWKADRFIRIDMEDYSHCQLTFNLLELLHEQYPTQMSTVIQAYLHRAEDDIDRLKGMNLRLVKGAYQESETVAYQQKAEIDERYVALIKRHLKSGSYTAIATHDHRIIERIQAFCKQEQIENDQFEFQLLYGFRQELQRQLLEEGYIVRIYVPFGTDWFGYFMRRLAERPRNLAFLFH